jgi:phosphoglycerate dehydrogenase-like enzyme
MTSQPSGQKVFIFAPREEPPELIKRLEDVGCDVFIGDPAWQLPGGSHEDELVNHAREAVVLAGTSIRNTPISRRIMEASQRLRVISKYSVGVDDVDVDAATELGILVTHAPTESNCFGVAETTVMMILAMCKRAMFRDAEVRAGKWREAHQKATFLGSRISDDYKGITIGLVGLGRIATRVAQLLAPWRVRIIACDPYIPPGDFLLAGVKAVSYEQLLRESDVVSFHVTLTKETRYMLRDEQIAMMKPGAIVVNTARGKVIEEAAVARAIEAGHLAGAAIDAFEVEPLPMDSPLRKLGTKVLMSPHSASFNADGELREGVAWAHRSIMTVLKGGVPDNVFNKEVIPRWRERFGGVSVIG